MKHMKHFMMIAVVIIAAVAGYMAFNRYKSMKKDNVEVQFLNFGGNYDSNSSYDQGYRAGMRDAQN